MGVGGSMGWRAGRGGVGVGGRGKGWAVAAWGMPVMSNITLKV